MFVVIVSNWNMQTIEARGKKKINLKISEGHKNHLCSSIFEGLGVFLLKYN